MTRLLIQARSALPPLARLLQGFFFPYRSLEPGPQVPAHPRVDSPPFVPPASFLLCFGLLPFPLRALRVRRLSRVANRLWFALTRDGSRLSPLPLRALRVLSGSRLSPLPLCVLCVLCGSHPASSDELWDRAVSIAAANRPFVPGRWHERYEIFNVKDEVVLRNVTDVSIEPSPAGAAVTLIRATTDSLDITEARRAAFEEEKDRFNIRDNVYNPFHPSAASRVQAKRDGRTRRVGEAVYIAYAYDQTSQSGKWKGTAWIEDHSGVPVEISAKKADLPEKDGEDIYREHVLNVHYSMTSDGDWYPVRLLRYKRGTLNNFPYSGFPAVVQTAVTLSAHWKITFK